MSDFGKNSGNALFMDLVHLGHRGNGLDSHRAYLHAGKRLGTPLRKVLAVFLFDFLTSGEAPRGDQITIVGETSAKEMLSLYIVWTDFQT